MITYEGRGWGVWVYSSAPCYFMLWKLKLKLIIVFWCDLQNQVKAGLLVYPERTLKHKYVYLTVKIFN